LVVELAQMVLQILDAWKPHFDDLLSSPGTTVVVGGADTGKTSFCTLLANRAVGAGIPTAVVDGDMGQSEIGPPTTVGLGLVENQVRALNDLEPELLCFIGSTSPVGHMVPSITGVKRLADQAGACGRKLVIVDTTGLVRGAIARKLKVHKIELLRARHIAALQKAGEAEHFLRFFDTWEDCTIHRLPVAPGVRAKTQMLRTQRRSVRFREYFLQGQVHRLSLEKVATAGTSLRTGNLLEPKYLKFAESVLKAPVVHGESADSGVYLVAQGEINRRGIEELQEQFRTKSILVVQAGRFVNLVVGLLDSHLDVLSLGIVQGIDFRAQTISIYTPLKSVLPVRSMRFGVLKLRPEGVEMGRIRPGEI
jgi:polynucleotide 5'-hydroxyl-kinase GRC3/NOL9